MSNISMELCRKDKWVKWWLKSGYFEVELFQTFFVFIHVFVTVSEILECKIVMKLKKKNQVIEKVGPNSWLVVLCTKHVTW